MGASLFRKGKGRYVLYRKHSAKNKDGSTLSFPHKFFSILFPVLFLQLFTSVWAQTVTLNVKNAPFVKVAEEISKQTKYDFSYNDRILKKARPVTLKLVKEPLTGALQKLLSEQPLSYEVRDGLIIITEKNQTVADQNAGLLSDVNGRVTNDAGVPLEAATIKVKNTNFGTRTNKNGEFIIPGKYANDILQIHLLGYADLEIGAQRARIVTLALTTADLNEVNVVVNTGYLKIDRRHLTSAVTTIRMDDIRTPGVNTIDKLLEGRVPGMIFMQNSGQVGAAPKLRIRGTSTILGNREPLWVLDGIVLTDPVNVDPQQINDLDFVNLLGNAIAGLNPDDIEQIDVLKDASATALYGAKAGNGVIVITTKKGKPGKPMISYSLSSGYTRRPRYADRGMYMMTSRERMDVSKEMVERGMHYNNITQWSGYERALQDYYEGKIPYDEFKRLSDYYANVNTDWLGLITRDAFTQNHTLNLSGGSNDIKYYSSIGYLNENGVINGENNKRYSSMLNVTADYKKFMAQIAFNGSYQVRNYTPSDLGIMNYAYNTSRTIPAYNPDGSLFYYPQTNGLLNYNYNILNERDNSNDHTDLISANIKALLKWRITKGLDVEGTFAFGISNNNRELYYTKDSYYIFKLRADQTTRWDLAPVGGELQKYETRNKSYTGRLQVNYITTLDKSGRHSLTATGGVEVKSNGYDGFNITRRGYFREMGGYFDIVPTTYTGYYQQWMSTKPALGYFNRQLTNDFAWFGTAGYSYDNRYLLNVHIRGEQSNLFGSRTNNRFLPIWAVSGRWNMKNDVLSDVAWINDLALKGSWGWQGNMLPGQSANMVIRQNLNTNPYYNETSSNIINYPNPDLKWEKTSSFNAGLEFSILKGKLSGSLAYFYKRTKDAFLDKTVSEINGVEKYVINSGTLENKGIEVALSIKAIDNASLSSSRRGFVWRIDPQLGQVLNKVLNRAINNRNNVLVDNITYDDFLNGSVQLSGKPINTFYSYKFKGLSPVDGSPIFYGAEPGLADEYNKKYSQMKREDVYLSVMSESGRREPFIQGGISNYFGWRNFGLSCNITYSLGNKIRMLKIASGYASAITYPQQNLRKEFVDRWRRPGDENYTNIPGLQATNALNIPWWNIYPASAYSFAGSVYDMYDNSDVRLVSADYVKLQSASFRYNFNEKMMRKLGFASAYVSITGTNLFTITNRLLKGQDPEQSGGSPNINLSIRPTYTGSINVSF
ncbi:TonB-linked outer membrane protein, SusC/RagA family [Chitinophaga ginsengisegetis]|uniref:TonB-linked outer membrane protein, SusC/RagA family n=1 Tax=Chitinophaga ginsengisegetis TaxID=393003 RepID=A0A1T5NJ96_9BACT|nr:SusC/RagA family TonB-linked outer membrane protein [Chitinophaga ginsengisegetis]SKD00680.1 TonB-linked outer membrane protein, SusC/RagA family [Chitinophaga ginsengisegetis]